MPEQNGAPNSAGADEPSLRDDLTTAFSEQPVDAGQEPPVDPNAAPVDPAAAPVLDGSGRVRDPVTKRFAKAPDQQEQQPPAQQQQPPAVQLTPPPSFSPTAKAKWAQVPPEVQAAIDKREKEVDAGFKKYAGLDQYVQQAQQSGTTLPEALGRYVAAEQLLEREPIKGILWLCNNYGITPAQLAQAAGGGQPQAQPQPAQNGQQPNGQQPYPGFDIRQQLDPVMQRLNELTQIVHGSQQEKVLSEVDTFFRDTKAHPYVENVAEDMAKLLSLGLFKDEPFQLQKAYEAACWNNPEVRGLLINDITSAQTADQANKAKQIANQARRAGQSITGGPAATQPSGAPETDDLRGQLQDAFRQQRVS